MFQPKVSSVLFAYRRKNIEESFYKQLFHAENIDGRKFWEFREFYSPGYFIFRRNGFTNGETKSLLSKMDLGENTIKDQYVFLSYNSDRIQSIEYLSEQKSIDDFLKTHAIDKKIVKQGEHFILYDLGSRKVLLVMLLSNDEMKKANGFFDYTEDDKELTTGKNLLDISLIQLD